MTDDHDETPQPQDLSPEEEAEVRRLLTEAGGPLTTPADVVARLDETLAGLVAERVQEADGDGPPATVTHLATRRRRWPTALLAAAAVVVVGYGLGNVVNGDMAGSDAGSAGGGSADSAESEPEAAADDAGGGDNLAALPRDGELTYSSTPRLRLSSDDFDAGVRRAVGNADDVSLTDDTSGQAASQNARKQELRKLRSALGRCAEPPSERRDRWFVVRYDGKVATLVVGPRRQGAVDARVYSCDGTTLLRASTVDLD